MPAAFAQRTSCRAPRLRQSGTGQTATRYLTLCARFRRFFADMASNVSNRKNSQSRNSAIRMSRVSPWRVFAGVIHRPVMPVNAAAKVLFLPSEVQR